MRLVQRHGLLIAGWIGAGVTGVGAALTVVDSSVVKAGGTAACALGTAAVAVLRKKAKGPLAAASTGDPAGRPLISVPAHREEFVDRVAPVEELLSVSRTPLNPVRCQVVAVVGPPGMGKSRTVYEFAARTAFKPYFDVWVVDASDLLALRTSLSGLAGELQIRRSRWEELPSSLWLALGHRGRFLVVFDNADSAEVKEAIAKDFLPRNGGGDIVVTSRDPDWAGIAGRTLTLAALAPADAAKVLALLASPGSPSPAAPDSAVSGSAVSASDSGLVAALGGRPGPLVNAIASMSVSRTEPGEYLRRLRSDPRGDDGYRVELPTEPDAAALLALLACFHSVRIPRALPWRHAAEAAADRTLSTVLSNVAAYDRALSTLVLYRLVMADERRIDVPTEVRAAALDASSAAKLGIAVRMLAAAFPADPSDPATWDECDRLLRHGVEVAQLAEARGVEPAARAVVFHAVGRYLHRRDDLAVGAGMLDRAIAAYQEAGDQQAGDRAAGDRVAEARVRVTLSRVLFNQAEVERAADEARLALDVLVDAGDRLDALFALAVALRELIRFDEAVELLAEARPLAARLSRETEHQLQLAGLLRVKGDVGSALRVAREAAEATRLTQGADSLAYGSALRMVGMCAVNAELYAEAVRVLTDSAAVLRATSGPDSQELTLKSDEHLALTFNLCGRQQEAVELLERSLKLREDVLRPDHPNTAGVRALLSDSYRILGRPREAWDQLELALRAFGAVYPPGHPYLVMVIVRQGPVLAALGRLVEAEKCAREALARYQGTYGDGHYLVAEALRGLAEVLRAKGDVAEARALDRQAAAIVAAAVLR